MILEKEEIIIKKFFTFICYQTNKIKVSDIKSIYYETNSLTGKFNIRKSGLNWYYKPTTDGRKIKRIPR